MRCCPSRSRVLPVNQGDDSNSEAATRGLAAGVCYGVEAIPSHWLECLSMHEFTIELTARLHATASS